MFQFLCVVTRGAGTESKSATSFSFFVLLPCSSSPNSNSSSWFQFLCVVTDDNQLDETKGIYVLVSLCCYFLHFFVKLVQYLVLVSLCCYLSTFNENQKSYDVLVSLCCYIQLVKKTEEDIKFQFLCVVTFVRDADILRVSEVLVSLCCYY